MARYAVGDLQGCLPALQQLLSDISFKDDRDQLWLVGDLVNRGPDSLGTLRYLYPRRDNLRIVLGNHDLHLLAMAHGGKVDRKNAELAAILQAPEAQQWIDWLLAQPLVYRDPSGDYIMSHAGLPNAWSSEQALSLSDEIQSVLQSSDAQAYFDGMYGNEPAKWQDSLQGLDRWRCITNYLTRMRLLTADDSLDLSFKGELDDAPAELKPWFANARAREEVLLFGHWAALNGNTGNTRILGLDTGCVWGGNLTAYALDHDSAEGDPQRFSHCRC